MLEQFIQMVQRAKLYGEGETLTADQIADLLWLADRMRLPSKPAPVPLPSPPSDLLEPQPSIEAVVETSPTEPSSKEEIIETRSPKPSTEEEVIETRSPTAELHPATSSHSPGLPFKTPAATALRHSLELARALKPLKRTVPSRTETILDEKATANRIARERLWLPVLKPAATRWLDVALVVEDSNSYGIWQQTIKEFHQLLIRQGAFRDVRLWYARSNSDGELQLFSSRSPHSPSLSPAVSPKTLIDPSRRRLILVVSDCVSPAWYRGQWVQWLQTWGTKNLVTILQMLPSKFWRRTALRRAESVWMSSRQPGASNSQWQVETQSSWEEEERTASGIAVPVVTFNPHALRVWAQAVGGSKDARIAGYCFAESSARDEPPVAPTSPFEDFVATTSPTARRLAALMAAVPVQLPIARLIQQTMLPQSDATHLAEVFLSGILRRTRDDPDPEKQLYGFVGEVRQQLNDSLPKWETARTIDCISAYISRRAGFSIQEFKAMLMEPSKRPGGKLGQEIQAFAEVTVEVLKHLGGEWAAFAAQLEGNVPPPPKPDGEVLTPETVLETLELEGNVDLPPEPDEDVLTSEPGFKTFSFDVATLEVVETQVFTFDVATLKRERGFLRIGNRWAIERLQRQATGIIEVLDGDVRLELMEIPGGTFLMGSPKDELGRFSGEELQHQVTVPPFYLGRYPVTQAQWQIVAGWERVERDLDPDPSNFKDPYEEYDRWSRPIERVSWYDAMEFCARLSRATGWEYRLPSEAGWEYACRGRITPPVLIGEQSPNTSEFNPEYGHSNAMPLPPFHFGETISTEVANYNGNYTYGEGPKGEHRKQTTPVGYFKMANAFGLYDLHGNVWEWCADPWHGNYEGAPDDGSTWLSSNINSYVLRGGSWNSSPRNCRSAYRHYFNPVNGSSNIGFRVVRSA